MKKLLSGALALLLCLGLFVPCASAAAEQAGGVLDQAEMQTMLDEYISSHRLDPEKISIGYIYTETGDSFYYNEDKWYYSASTYKVPVMMLLAEKEAAGELTRDSVLMGMTLGYAEEIILTYSNNDYAHAMMAVLAPSEPECRDMYKKFVDLPDDYYISDFRDYSYFTARFLTGVLQTLYNDPGRFPNIIDCLLAAQPEHYFRIHLGKYDIAQKYGSYRDYYERFYNHTTGVIYLPHPIILTVMTQDAPDPESVIAELAKLFADYTLDTVDGRLAAYEAEQEAARLAAQEQARREEEERLAAEEAERLAAAEPTPEPTPEPTAEPTPEPAPEATPEAAAEAEAESVSRGQNTRLYVLLAAGLALLLAVALTLLRKGKRGA